MLYRCGCYDSDEKKILSKTQDSSHISSAPIKWANIETVVLSESFVDRILNANTYDIKVEKFGPSGIFMDKAVTLHNESKLLF